MTAKQAIRICEVCDRFEWELIAGAAPTIEEYLEKASIEDRDRLLENLLGIELEWRLSAGEQPSTEDYTERLPDHSERIERILREQSENLSEPQRSIGRYVLIEELGRGGEGIVYRAREEGPASREVAVKLMTAGAIGSRDAALRFVHQIRCLARIHHDHIVPYYDSGDDRGQLYYVMRLMPLTLAKRPGPMDPMQAVSLMIPIVEAVRFLHSQPIPIVHRDLKPGNILLDENGRPYVADFGLALLLDGEGDLNGACGTFPYIAPEQFDRRFGEIGPACDVYSLGVILYELLTGQRPFPHNRESIIPTLEREPLRPSRLRPGIPGELETICLTCLRKSTQERYKSADELLKDLHSFER
jgi:eukaryotic-like serine/threonine-protein kinase